MRTLNGDDEIAHARLEKNNLYCLNCMPISMPRPHKKHNVNRVLLNPSKCDDLHAKLDIATLHKQLGHASPH